MDIPANFAVDQDPVLEEHPAFQGLAFETPPGTTPSTDPSITRHGTALVSIAAAQGPSGCALCTAADADEKGVAPGLSKILDPNGAGAESDWAAGVPYYSFDSSTSTWKLQPPAPDPAQVINYSRGADATYDDALIPQTFDATVDAYGVTMTVAAGNSGPAARSVNDPAIAYNVIGVGAFSGGGTTDPSDDTVFGWSSRGPTVAGRKKPDLVAVGDGGLAYSYYQETGKLWKYDTGTSYAAPQVGGGAILLAGAGIRDPQVVKAILINSARQGRATPSSPMGTQTGWLPDWGWGEMNLDAAYHQRLNFGRDQVPANGARFFRATDQAAGDRATLVWHRRVADCTPLRQGCYYDTDSGFHTYALSNLDLTEYDAATGAPRAASTSAIDNVEQVRAPAPGNVVYKVSAGHIDGPPAEPFALAATRPLTPLATPKPTVTLTLSAAGNVRAGTAIDVTADVANPSTDLTAEDANVTLELPAGVELVGSDATQPLGTLATEGAAGDHAVAHWTVSGTAGGVNQLVAIASASRYGSTFTSAATGSFSIDATPPAVTLTATPPTDGTVIQLAWGATDEGAGVGSFDVDVSTDAGPFVPWLTATSLTSSAYDGARGSRYRFRVRATDSFGNVSQYVVSPEIAIGASAPPKGGDDDGPGGGGGGGINRPARQSPKLKITRVGDKGRRLTVRGTVARAANGKVTAVWRGRANRGARGSTYAKRRAFRLVLRLPAHTHRGRLNVTYLGDDRFSRQSRSVIVRSR